MAYDTNNILKGMDVTKPDGASEYGSILDNAMKEVKRCLANEFSVKTVSSFPYTVLETDSLLLLNGTGTVNMIQCSTVSSTSIRKEYTLIQVSGTGTIAAYSGDSVPVSTLTVGQMVKMIGVGGTTWYEDKSYKTESIYDGSAYRSASATPVANTVPIRNSNKDIGDRNNNILWGMTGEASATGSTDTTTLDLGSVTAGDRIYVENYVAGTSVGAAFYRSNISKNAGTSTGNFLNSLTTIRQSLNWPATSVFYFKLTGIWIVTGSGTLTMQSTQDITAGTGLTNELYAFFLKKQ